jgi:hypothetical protein
MVFLASKGELLGLKHEDIGDGSENFVRVVRRNNHIVFKRTDYQFKLAHKLCDMAIAICPVGWVRLEVPILTTIVCDSLIISYQLSNYLS